MSNSVNMANNANVVHGSFRRSIVSRVIDQIKVWNERRAAIRQLNALSDRLLLDIGVERHEIAAVVKKQGEFTRLVAEETSRPEVSGEIRKAA